MNVTQIKETNYSKAIDELSKYRSALRKRREPHLRTLARCWYQLSRGRGVIDAYAAFKQAGLNSNGDPAIAICRADQEKVTFERRTERDQGAGAFTNGQWQTSTWLVLPSGTYPKWPMTKDAYPSISRRHVETVVPIIPADLLPAGKLSAHYIMWEVDDWQEVPSDPILLRRLSKNLFAVLATWDLTPLEKALLNGRST